MGSNHCTGGNVPKYSEEEERKWVAEHQATADVYTITANAEWDPGRRDAEFERVSCDRTFWSLIPKGWDPDEVRIHLDGEDLPRDRWRLSPLPNRCNVTILRVPQFEAAVVSLVAAFIFSGATQAFLPGVPAKKRGDETSPTYSFDGVAESRVDGLPVQLAYGRIKMGGQVIAEYSRTESFPPITTLYILKSFGHGRFRSVGGLVGGAATGAQIPSEVSIQGNAASNLSGVTFSARTGFAGQPIIDGFEVAKTELAVGLDLLQETTTSEDNSTLGGGLTSVNDLLSAASNPTWNLYGRTFDITTPADSFTVRILFPDGLFRVNDTTGDVDNSEFQLAIRYRELDATNTPITTGGLDGDGYVRLPARPALRVGQRGQFRIEYDQPLYDPQTWPGQTLGSSLDCTTGAQISLPINAATYPFSNNQAVPRLTTSLWFRFNNGQLPIFPTDAEIRIGGDYDAANNRGWEFILQRRNVSQFGVPAYTWNAAVRFGDGTTTTILREGFPGIGNRVDDEAWYHVAFTAYNDATVQRYRLYLNGDEIGSRNDTGNRLAANRASIDLNRDGSQMRIDDLYVFEETFSGAQVDTTYNDGLGEVEQGADARAHYRFETAAVTNTAEPAADQWYGTGVGAADGGDAEAAVYSVDGAEQRRIRAQVEVLRLNQDSTDDLVTDDSEWEAVVTTINSEVDHSGLAIAGFRIPAVEQLNTSRPSTSVIVEGRRIPNWNGNTVNPGVGIGYSANPARVVLDLLITEEVGLGERYNLRNLDLPEWAEWRDYCDEIVYDGTTLSTAGAGLWSDLRNYDAAGVDEFGTTTGTFDILFNADLIPATFVPGRWVKFYNVPTPAGFVPIGVTDTTVAGGGYRIKDRTPIAGFVSLTLIWDRLEEGAPFNAGTTLATQLGATLAPAALSGGEPRFEFNGVFDDEGTAWDRIQAVCSSARATAYRSGGKIRFLWDRPRTPIGIVTMGHIIKDSFSCKVGGKKFRPNAVDLDYLDRNLDFEQVPERVLHRSVTNVTDANEVRIAPAEFLLGCTSRSQARRQGTYLCNRYQDPTYEGVLSMSRDGIPLEPGDVVYLAHSVLPRKGYSGRLSEDATEIGGNQIVFIDVPFEIEAGLNYRLYLQQEETGDWDSRSFTTAAGSYPQGTNVTIAGAPNHFPWLPVKRDAFIIAADERRLLAEVVSTTLKPDLSVEVKWREYRDSVYEDTVQEFASTETSLLTTETGNSPLIGSGLVPNPPSIVGIDERMVRSNAGSLDRVVFVSWENDLETISELRETVVSYSVDGGQTDTVVATVEGNRETVQFKVPRGIGLGREVRVFLQPVGYNGQRQASKASRSVTLSDQGPVPEPISNPSASMVGDRVLYKWDLAENHQDAVIECRRGGWVLGQVVFVSEPGATSILTENWSGSTVGGTTLYFRAVSPLGMYSSSVSLVYEPTPALDYFPFEGQYPDQAWEAYGTGWVDTGSADDAELTDLQINAGNLEFAGTALTGTYKVADPVLRGLEHRVAQDCFIEAVLVGQQIHPDTFASTQSKFVSPAATAADWEGPIQPGNAACTAEIQMRFNETGATTGWTDWNTFSPGRYRLIEAQFRVIFTRPDDTYQIEVSALRTRIQPISRQNGTLSPFTLYHLHEMQL